MLLELLHLHSPIDISDRLLGHVGSVGDLAPDGFDFLGRWRRYRDVSWDL